MKENTTSTARKFDKEFKTAAVDMWRTSGKTRKEVAAELGVSEWNLRDWKKALNGGKTASPVVRPRTLNDVEAENVRLRQENLSLRNQRDILKKSLGILSEPLAKGSRI